LVGKAHGFLVTVGKGRLARHEGPKHDAERVYKVAGAAGRTGRSRTRERRRSCAGMQARMDTLLIMSRHVHSRRDERRTGTRSGAEALRGFTDRYQQPLCSVRRGGCRSAPSRENPHRPPSGYPVNTIILRRQYACHMENLNRSQKQPPVAPAALL